MFQGPLHGFLTVGSQITFVVIHLCLDSNNFLYGKHNTIIIPDCIQVKVKMVGTVKLDNGLELKRVLYVPDFKYNLISVHKLCLDKNIKISFIVDLCVMQDGLKKPLLLGKLRNNLYYAEEKLVSMTNETLSQQYISSAEAYKNKNTHNAARCVQEKMSLSQEKIELWYLRLEHMPFNRLNIVFSYLQCKEFDKNLCTLCPLGKQTKKPFNKSAIKTTDSFQLVHIDLWGPLKFTTKIEVQYFLHCCE